MVTFSTSDLSRRSGDIIAEALRKPVTIAQRGTPRLVVMSIEDYRRLTERADPRVAMTLDAIPPELAEEMLAAIEDYEKDGPA